MRGKVLQKRVMKNLGRITPAYAGKSLQVNRYRSLTGDHPRVCGEKEPMFQFALPASGSPPRMRGKGGAIYAEQPKLGITPAYAGKRLHQPLRRNRRRDHPRVCGEKDRSQPDGQLCAGITPAYAGKSIGFYEHKRGTRDHPRVCGEKCVHADYRNTWRGSPPRMRGKVPSG